jgi:hypothetical protein
MIKSVAPSTKSGLYWCPTGFTPTHKQRLQRLRALEVKKEIAKKKRNELFNRDKPMVPKVTWRDKYIAKKTYNLVYTKLTKHIG